MDGTLQIRHSETGQEWNVLEGPLKACSLVFSRMLQGDFKEATSKCVSIDDMSPEAIEGFVNLVEYPRGKMTFEQLAESLDLSLLARLLDKYDVDLFRLLLDLVAAEPKMSNIVAAEELLQGREHSWGPKVIDYIVKETLGSAPRAIRAHIPSAFRNAAPMPSSQTTTTRGGGVAAAPTTAGSGVQPRSDQLQCLRSATLAAVLVRVNTAVLAQGVNLRMAL
jgi:hypothetical protein